MITLFAYVDGYDLGEIEHPLLGRLNAFVHAWGIRTARVINDKLARTDELGADDLPVWNLGLNFVIDRLPHEKIEELVHFLGALAKETGREFVVGHWDAGRGISSDWCSIGPEPTQNLAEIVARQIQGLA